MRRPHPSESSITCSPSWSRFIDPQTFPDILLRPLYDLHDERGQAFLRDHRPLFRFALMGDLIVHLVHIRKPGRPKDRIIQSRSLDHIRRRTFLANRVNWTSSRSSNISVTCRAILPLAPIIITFFIKLTLFRGQIAVPIRVPNPKLNPAWRRVI